MHHSGLIPAALSIGHHFSISVWWNASVTPASWNRHITSLDEVKATLIRYYPEWLKNFPKQNGGPIGTLLGYRRNQSTMPFLSDPTLQIVLLTAACAGFPRIDAAARRVLAHFVVLTANSSELSGGLGRPNSLHG